jgi:transposase
VADANASEWLGEHRLRAVMEVRAGAAVAEVAVRYGVSRQSVYAWVVRYERDGPAGLVDKSRRPRTSPHRISAEVEALICELRRSHPRWGARRLVFELAERGITPGAGAGHGASSAGAQWAGGCAGAASPA